MSDYSHHECALVLFSAGQIGCIETYEGSLSLPWMRALDGEPAADAGVRSWEITGYVGLIDETIDRIFKICDDGVARTLLRGNIVAQTPPIRLAGGYFRWVNLDEAISRLPSFDSSSVKRLHVPLMGGPHA